MQQPSPFSSSFSNPKTLFTSQNPNYSTHFFTRFSFCISSIPPHFFYISKLSYFSHFTLMSGSGGFAVSRSHGEDRFYNPPPIRRHQQWLLQQQFQSQHLLQLQTPPPVEAENPIHSDDSLTTLSKLPTVSSPAPPTDATNLDRLMESLTPFVPLHFPEVSVKGRMSLESELHPFYCLGDLWEAFSEWSVYGVGVPLLLNGKDSIVQYYVPFLSGIQLYLDPLKPPAKHRLCDETGVESSRESSSGGSSDCEGDRSSRNQQFNIQKQLNRSSLRGKSVVSSSSPSNDAAEISSSPGHLFFEYFEHEQPHNRHPLTDKVSALASQCPQLRICRSCDLMPASWLSVAWYPIYRIPMGSTLRDLDASFLTFHSLSTHSKSNANGVSGRKLVHKGVDGASSCSNMSLPVFGLASYKFKGSILSQTGAHVSEQENSLLQAAQHWLESLRVGHPDFQFFRNHSR